MSQSGRMATNGAGVPTAVAGSATDIGSVAIMFHRLGPYHHARLSAAAGKARIRVIEVTTVDPEYPWSSVPATAFEKWTLCNGPVERKSVRTFETAVDRVLRQLSPTVVFLPGWGTWWAIASLRSCLRVGARAVMMSESTAHDAWRLSVKETVKRRVVGLCSTALVGGEPQVEYLMALGMPRERIFTGYDVVDNEYFAGGASAARLEASGLRQRLGLPPKYFLASARFIERKNLPRLLQAYASYRARAGGRAWKLVLLGDGPLRWRLERVIGELALDQHVWMPGFQQYDELPAYYGLAAAFVHASTVEPWGLVVNEAMAAGLPVLVSERCGCAVDLVRPGCNGFTFDPFDADSLADLMLTLAADDCDRTAMGEASRCLIDGWTPATFAEAVVAASRAALNAPEPRPLPLDRALLWALARR